jgi:hypothetical protein
MHVTLELHLMRSMFWNGKFMGRERSLDDDMKRFFKLFQESTFEGSRVAAQKMKEIAERQTNNGQRFLLFQSLDFLIRSDLEMLSWPNSPLLVILQFVNPNTLAGREHVVPSRGYVSTPLHHVANLADPFDYSTHKKQLIIAQQLIEHGASVNTASIPQGLTPLHDSCFLGVVTNLDYVELLLEAGADPNVQDRRGQTPLIFCACSNAPGAAKFLMNWPTTDVNITTRAGASFLALVRSNITTSDSGLDRVQKQYLLRQWREIEEMLVERGATDTGISSFE